MVGTTQVPFIDQQLITLAFVHLLNAFVFVFFARKSNLLLGPRPIAPYTCNGTRTKKNEATSAYLIHQSSELL